MNRTERSDHEINSMGLRPLCSHVRRCWPAVAAATAATALAAVASPLAVAAAVAAVSRHVDSDPIMEGTDVPLSATTSSAGAMAFVKSVAATSDNKAEPIRVGDAVLATSETDEPDPPSR